MSNVRRFRLCPLSKAAKKAAKSKGGKKDHGGTREEIRRLQEMLGVDDANRTPQVLSLAKPVWCMYMFMFVPYSVSLFEFKVF